MEDFKKVMSSKFEMKDLGLVEYVVGLRVESTKNMTHLSQSLYGQDILKRFNLQDSNTAKTPLPERTILYPKGPNEEEGDSTVYRSMVGSLMYSMLGSRPDLAFTVGQLSRHLHACTSKLIQSAEQVFRYLKYTIDDGLSYTYTGPNDKTSRRKAVFVTGYSDADWAGDVEDSKSTSGYIITMANAPIIWKSMKQKSVAKSSTEAETAAADSCTNEVIWVRGMLDFFGFPQKHPTELFMDNVSAIKGIQNGNTTQRNKFFRVRMDAMHNSHMDNEIKFLWMKTDLLPADALTKSLSGPTLLKHKRFMNLVPISHGLKGRVGTDCSHGKSKVGAQTVTHETVNV